MTSRFATFWPSAPEAVRKRLPGCEPCGKNTYPTRKDARAAARALHPGAKGLQAYRCRVSGQGWHYGHRRPLSKPTEQTAGGGAC